jgi:hypothetical protein
MAAYRSDSELLRAALESYARTSQILVKQQDLFVFVPEKMHQTGAGFLVSPGLRITATENGLALDVNSHSVHIERGILPDVIKGDQVPLIAVLVPGSSRVVVAVYNEAGRPFEVFCLDGKTGALVWRRRVVPLIPVPRVGGAHHEHIELVANTDIVAVFGVIDTNCCLDVFEVDKGEKICQFRTGP